jgi:AcrR family transcriptional regulator
MATHQRSRESILQGAKLVITEVGSYESNMFDIAARAEVSRATIYNHFADKEEMMTAIVEFEIDRLIALAKASADAESALYALSREISEDEALAKMVETDHDDIITLTTITAHPLWSKVHRGLAEIFGNDENTVGLILRWLIAQITSPLTESQSKIQTSKLISIL